MCIGGSRRDCLDRPGFGEVRALRNRRDYEPCERRYPQHRESEHEASCSQFKGESLARTLRGKANLDRSSWSLPSCEPVQGKKMDAGPAALRLRLRTLQCLSPRPLGSSTLRVSELIQGISQEGVGLEVFGLGTFRLLQIWQRLLRMVLECEN